MFLQNKKLEYNELSKAKISDTRNLVISIRRNGGFTIGQQLITEEKMLNKDGERIPKQTSVFLTGAIHLDDVDKLYEIRDAFNIAIKLYEEQQKEDSEWDE